MRARMNLKFYSVSLTWHNNYILRLQRYEKTTNNPNYFVSLHHYFEFDAKYEDHRRTAD